MIVSHKYKFIFLKTNKTAGTSIEIALSQFCGETDVITPIPPIDERVRRELGHRGPQNLRVPPSQSTAFYNHISANEVRQKVGATVWNEYYKFCFERNPWDRVISFYFWRCQNEPRPSISAFIESDEMSILKEKGINLYTISGTIAVNRVCLYENLQGELDEICSQIGLPGKLALPNAKSGYRMDKRHYSEILSDKDAARIAEIFAEEISLYGYTY